MVNAFVHPRRRDGTRSRPPQESPRTRVTAFEPAIDATISTSPPYSTTPAATWPEGKLDVDGTEPSGVTSGRSRPTIVDTMRNTVSSRPNPIGNMHACGRYPVSHSIADAPNAAPITVQVSVNDDPAAASAVEHADAVAGDPVRPVELEASELRVEQKELGEDARSEHADDEDDETADRDERGTLGVDRGRHRGTDTRRARRSLTSRTRSTTGIIRVSEGRPSRALDVRVSPSADRAPLAGTARRRPSMGHRCDGQSEVDGVQTGDVQESVDIGGDAADDDVASSEPKALPEPPQPGGIDERHG